MKIKININEKVENNMEIKIDINENRIARIYINKALVSKTKIETYEEQKEKEKELEKFLDDKSIDDLFKEWELEDKLERIEERKRIKRIIGEGLL